MCVLCVIQKDASCDCEIVERLSLATVGVNSFDLSMMMMMFIILSYSLYDQYILVFAENAVNLF